MPKLERLPDLHQEPAGLALLLQQALLLYACQGMA